MRGLLTAVLPGAAAGTTAVGMAVGKGAAAGATAAVDSDDERGRIWLDNRFFTAGVTAAAGADEARGRIWLDASFLSASFAATRCSMTSCGQRSQMGSEKPWIFW